MGWNEALSVLSRLNDTSDRPNEFKASNLLTNAKSECRRRGRGVIFGGNGENCVMSMIENPETFHSMNALDFLNYHFTPYGDERYTGPMQIDSCNYSHADYVAALKPNDIHTCLGMWVQDWVLVTTSRYFWYRLLGNMVEYDTNGRLCRIARRALGDTYACLVHKLNPIILLSELKSHQGVHPPTSPTSTADLYCSGSGSSATNSDTDDVYRGEFQVVNDGIPDEFEEVNATACDGGYSADGTNRAREIDDSGNELVETITRQLMTLLNAPYKPLYPLRHGL
jgi:hypothetical protein